jgi:hypothetical protein
MPFKERVLDQTISKLISLAVSQEAKDFESWNENKKSLAIAQ